MGPRRCVVVAFIAGCTRVYGIDKPQQLDAGDQLDALPATCQVLHLGVDKDTYLVDNTPRGGNDAMIVSATVPAIFRFEIGTQIPASTHVAAAVLDVVAVDTADECGTTGDCVACPTDQATTYFAYWNTSDWSDNEATVTDRRTGTPWGMPSATGLHDRSTLVAMHPLPATHGELRLPLTMTDVSAHPTADPDAPKNNDWLRLDTGSSPAVYQLTIQLLTDQPIALASDDNDTTTCPMQAAPATLDLTMCQ